MSVPPPPATTTSLPKPKVVQSHPRVVQSHPKVLAPAERQGSSKGLKPQHPSVLRGSKTVVGVRSDKPILTLWGSSHLAKNQLLGPDLKLNLGNHFKNIINLSEGGVKLTNELTDRIQTEFRSHPGPKQVYVILFGDNNMRKTTKPGLEVAKVVSRFRRIMAEAQKAKVRILLCGTIPDLRPAVDSKLKLLDAALQDLDMGQGNNFLSMRGMMLDTKGQVRTELYKQGDIHLSAAGTKIVSLRIRTMLEIMIPAAPVPTSVPVAVPVAAPVPTPAPATVQVPVPAAPAVQAAPAVVATPAVVQQLAEVQDPAAVQAPVAESEQVNVEQVNPFEQVETVKPVNPVEPVDMEADQKPFEEEFGDIEAEKFNEDFEIKPIC